MTPLAIPVPPQLESAVGYHGEARWLSLCWTCLGDTVLHSDGRSSGTGHGWGYLGFVRHPSVAPLLRELDLGSSECDGTEQLLIDRQERRAFVAEATEARSFLREQFPAEPEVELTAEQWQEVVEEVRQRMLSRPLPSMSDLMEQMRQHSALVADMVRWLDAKTRRADQRVTFPSEQGEGPVEGQRGRTSRETTADRHARPLHRGLDPAPARGGAAGRSRRPAGGRGAAAGRRRCPVRPRPRARRPDAGTRPLTTTDLHRRQASEHS